MIPYRLRFTCLLLCVASTSVGAADDKQLPKPRKEGEKGERGEWFGKKVLPKKFEQDIRMCDWVNGKQEFWEPRNLLDCVVREDRDGFLRLFDGRREGWVSKDDMVTAEDAPAYFDKAVKADPKDANAWLMRGIGWRDQGEYDKAIKDFTEVIRLIPDWASGHAARGQAWQAKKECEKAVADYTEAVRLKPKSAMNFNNRGTAWADQKRYDKAIPDYDQALELDPKLTLGYYNRGNARYAKKEYDQAAADYDQAIKLDPTDAYTVAARAITASRLKRHDEAVKLFDRAVELQPLAWIDRDYALFRASCPDEKYRDGKKAMELAKNATRKAGKDADWEYHAALAAAYAEVGDFDAAVVEQQKAIEMLKKEPSPDADDLKKATSRLELYRAKKPYRDEG